MVETTGRVTSYGYVLKGSPEAVLTASINTALRLHEAYRQVKEKERMLKMGEERSRKAQEIARVGNWELDLRTNKIWASEEAFRIYGIEQAPELPLALVQQTVLPQYRSRMDRALHRLVRQVGEYDEEFQIKRLSDGLLRFIHSRAEVILSADGTPMKVAGVIQDITERKRSEEALLAKQLQLSEAMDLAHIVYWEADPVTNAFVFNDSFYAFFGTNAEKEGGYRMRREDYAQRFVHPDDQPLFYQFVEQCTSKPGPESVSDIEHRIIRRDGEVRHILTRVRIIKDDSDNIVKGYGAIQDITERKQAEEALRDNEATLRSLINTTRETLLLIDPEGNILLANETVAQRLGLSTRELIGNSLYEHFPPEVAVRRKAELDKVVRTGQPVRFMDERADRTYESYGYPVFDNEGRVAKVAIFAVDITERKRAEEELQKAHRRLSDIIDFLPDATFVIDREKRVVAWNRAIEEMTGVKKEEMLGKGNYAVSFYGEPRPVVIDLVLERNEEMQKIADHGQGEGSKLSMEVYVPKAYCGKGAYLSATASPLFDREGNVVGAIETIRDTTEQKRIERALQESEESYRTAIESSNDGITILKGLNVIFVNRRFLESFGFQSPDEIIGQSIERLVHPDDRDRIREMNERESGVRRCRVATRSRA